MKHRWRVLRSDYVRFPYTQQKNDVHVCDVCGQIALSAIGGRVPDDHPMVDPCDVSVVKTVMGS